MADISTTFDELLAQHKAHINHHRRFQSDVVDEFLKEAYRINSHISSLHTYLRSIRQSYLSTSLPPRSHTQRHRHTNSTSTAGKERTYLTDPQRDQIDTASKSTLRSLAAGISQIESAEKIRRETEDAIVYKKRNKHLLFGGRISAWAAGEGQAKGGGREGRSPVEISEDLAREGVGLHREGVVWYLKRKLEEVVALQRGMVEVRIEREVERGKSVFWKATEGVGKAGGGVNGSAGGGGGGKEKREGWEGANGHSRGRGKEGGSREADYQGKRGTGFMDEKERLEIENALSPEQLQLFAEENREMVKRYEDTLDQVRQAESSLLEISSLQSTLASNLEIQASQIDVLVEDAANTQDNVSGGNKQLKRATERWRPARMVFWTTVGLCGFLVGWDLVF